VKISLFPLRYRRALLSFIAILLVFFAILVAVIISHEREMLEGANKQAEHEIHLVGSLLRESLLKFDYATVEQFLVQWGEEHADIVEVRATAPNGFVLAQYTRAEPSKHTFHATQQVQHGGRDLVALDLVKDFTPVRSSLYKLGARLIAGAVLLTVLVGAALWFSLRRLALVPLETEIMGRKEAEGELQRAHDELEARVEDRTEELQEEMDRAQRYLDVAGVMLVVIGVDQRVRLINKKGCKILGYDEDEIVGKNWFDNFLPERMRSDVRGVFDMLMAGRIEPVEYFENPILTKDGEERVIAWRNAVLYGSEGNPSATLSSGEDITKRKEAEERLAYSESYLRSIIEAEPECVKVVSPDGMVIQMNQAGLEMVEAMSAEEVVGKAIYPLIRPEHRDAFGALLQSVCNGNAGNLEFEIVGLRGGRRWLDSHAVPFRGEREDGPFMLAVTRDITERRRLEEQLHQARRMEAIGTLTGGIAHDFNNILSAIIGFGESVEMEMAQDDPLRPYLEQMLGAAEKGTELTHNLLAFGRKLVIKPGPSKVNGIIEAVEKLIPSLIGEGIKRETVLAEPALTIMADVPRVEQALINLITNARDAMPNGGTLRISASEVRMDSEFIRENGFGKPGVYCLLSVSDTGGGMDEAIRQRMFEPFFTTKAFGMGTGLGLSTVFGIIKQHNGFIKVHSEPGRGTTANIYLPVVRLEVRKEAAAADLPPLIGGTETVLVAEDDTAVRKIATDVLKKFGYTVLEAADGEEAVKVFLENKDEVHLLVLDVVMPKLSGKGAYDEIRKTRPDIKTLFTSGHVSEVVNKEVLQYGLDFLPKPASPKQLIRKVREVLDKGT
jgi:PAS domain S-box-containing protein